MMEYEHLRFIGLSLNLNEKFCEKYLFCMFTAIGHNSVIVSELFTSCDVLLHACSPLCMMVALDIDSTISKLCEYDMVVLDRNAMDVFSYSLMLAGVSKMYSLNYDFGKVRIINN